MPWAVKQFAVECLLAELSSSRSPTEGSSRGVPDVGFRLRLCENKPSLLAREEASFQIGLGSTI